jgi:GntR family transcriptional regulator
MNLTDDPTLTLHGGSSIPCQIAEQIRTSILAGQLEPGEQLPTVRRVAVELAINPSTVSQAYAELEREGFLTSQDGSGTFVASPAPLVEPRQFELESLCAGFLRDIANQGFAVADVLRTLQTFSPRRQSP